MTERTLFDGIDPGTLARRADPATSAEAAAGHVASGANARQCRLVLGAVRRAPGSTSDELAADLGVVRYLTARRLPDLERLGLVRRGEPRVSRVGRRRGVTWYPVEPGGVS